MRITALLLLILLSAFPVSAAEFSAPLPSGDALDRMPVETTNFWEGLLEVLEGTVEALAPEFQEAAVCCCALIGAVILVSIVSDLPVGSGRVTQLCGTLAVASILLDQTRSLIALGAETVTELSDYGKLLLPVMTAALAAQGGVGTSAALYAGTACFDALLSSAVSSVLLPMIYVFLALCVAASATADESVGKLRDGVKWGISWFLKGILYIFTAYLGITGVVSGTADAAAVKAAKLTISGMVPVVGGILSDASESLVVGAGLMKNAAGVYGLLAVAAVFILPFLRIGVHYLLLKLTAAVCGVFGSKMMTGLIKNFSAAMGLLLAMTGAVCFILLISTVCFMKGMG